MVLREELDFNKDSDKWIFFKSYPYGKEVNENMLLAGDILCVSKIFDGSYIRGWQCSQTVSGKVDKVAGNTDDRLVTIDGEQYQVAHYYKDKIVTGEQDVFCFRYCRKNCVSRKANAERPHFGIYL